jgi:hypothetical protein
MTDASQTPIPGPSGRQLAMTTTIALIVAAIILVTIVLPAEYAIDPLGTGERLGLTAMARASAPPPLELPTGEAGLKPVANGPEMQYGAPFKTDTIQFILGPYEYIEYKYVMEEGAQMQFSWTASAPVVHEFHGERADDVNAVTSFDKSTRQDANGALSAPFRGIHGWYWENPGGEPITVTLKSNGFYASAIEFRSDKTQLKHELKTP